MDSIDCSVFPEPTLRIITFKALRLSRQPGFTPSDEEDIRHDLWLHLVQKAPQFDSTVTPWATWISFVLGTKCCDLWRRRNAAKRSPLREEYSLDDEVFDGDDRLVRRANTIPDPGSNGAGDVDRRLELVQLLDGLPTIQQEIGRRLGDHSKLANARELNVSRGEVDLHVNAIRRAAEDAGLQVYL